MPITNRFTVNPVWEGQTVAIVGGGPSLSLKQIHYLARARGRGACRVIAVNDAIFPCYFADWLHAGDSQWWWWHIQEVHTFKGTKTTLADDIPAPWVDGYLKNTGHEGFDPNPNNCRTGQNSLYQAMHIAMHAGAKKIVLLGADMKKAENGESHWFGEHPDKIVANHAKQMVPRFDSLKPFLAAKGISVLNASPGTALESFPLCELGAAISW